MSEWRVIHHAVTEQGMVWVEMRETAESGREFRGSLINDNGEFMVETYNETDMGEIVKGWAQQWKDALFRSNER